MAAARTVGVRWTRVALATLVVVALGVATYVATGNPLVATVGVIVGVPVFLFVLGVATAGRRKSGARDALDLGGVVVRFDLARKTFEVTSTLPAGALGLLVLYLFDDAVGRYPAAARKLIPAMGAWAQSRGKGDLTVVTPFRSGAGPEGGPELAVRLIRIGEAYEVEIAALDPALASGVDLAAALPAVAEALLARSGVPTDTFFDLLEQLASVYTRGQRERGGGSVDRVLRAHPAFARLSAIEKPEPNSNAGASQRS